MIKWKDVQAQGKFFSDRQKRVWKKTFCAAQKKDGECSGYPSHDNSGPHVVCKNCSKLKEQ